MSIALFLLLFTGAPTHFDAVNLVCTGKTGAIITNNGGWISGITVDGDTTKGCLVWTDNDQVRNITINGYHYDKCGPTHDGITPCVRYGPKKTVDNYLEPSCNKGICDCTGSGCGTIVCLGYADDAGHCIDGDDGTDLVWRPHDPDPQENAIRDYLYFIQEPVKPHQYDIEIRTKRERKEVKSWSECTDRFVPDHNFGLYGVCERVTKTLWIDGQRVGVIRETEDK